MFLFIRLQDGAMHIIHEVPSMQLLDVVKTECGQVWIPEKHQQVLGVIVQSFMAPSHLMRPFASPLFMCSGD